MSRLSTQQLARMSRLLDEVIDADEAQRRRWLQALPDEHRDLAPALRAALCPPQGDGPRWLDTLPKLGGSGTDLQPGDPVGPYRLVRPIGSGGMAEVWLARRADGAFEREVALKTPVRLEQRQGLARRFAVERDILATLEHPRIARFYDAGTSHDGRPYLALEYVPGRNLLHWADAQRLGVRQRIGLFLQVIEAVQYAHDKGVLHRDLKPGNVLVTEAGQVHLLDFGVARRIDRSAQADLTQAHGAALTPAYASPEQLEGERLDVTSDVYSLGVLLHELLSGRHPPSAASAHGAQRPSEGLSAHAAEHRGSTEAALRRALAGDLDAIVAKATAALPARRYASAAALGDDLRRHLANEPVQAMPQRLPYRGARFLARHRSGVAQAALACLAAAGIGFALWQRQPAGEDLAAPIAGGASAAVAPQDSAAQRRTEAQDLLQQGDVYANGPFERDAERAEVALRKAAALVPDDALPWAKLAWLHLARAAQSPASRDERHALAREAMDTALHIDARSMAARAARFRYAVEVDHRWPDARAELDQMRLIDPKDAAWLPACEARMASVFGRLDEAVRIQQRIVERDPHDAAAAAALASYLFRSGRFEEALAALQQQLRINPHAAGAHAMAGAGLALLGRGEQALAAIEKEPLAGLRLWSLAIAQWSLGRRGESQAALDELKRHPKGNAYALAQLHALQGQRGPAFEWLQRACLERQGGCENLRTDRFLRTLRDDARYRALLARLKLDGDPLPTT